MSNNEKNSDRSMYDQQESKLSAQSAAFIQMLTKRGILEDPDIDDEKIREAAKKKKRNMYHNTLMMLQHYRNISWALECFPTHIAEELDHSMNDLDALLSLVNAEIGMNNVKLENRLQSVQRSRLLLDRINEALTVLKQKPGNGELMYKVIYETFITPEKLSTPISCIGCTYPRATITASVSRLSTFFPFGCGQPLPASWIPGWRY